MPFDPISYLRDLGIPFKTEGKNVSAGWANIRCPRCPPHDPDPEMHGGFAPSGHKGKPYSCWRCGGSSLEKVIIALEQCDYLTACNRIRQYQFDHIPVPIQIQRPAGKLQLPLGTGAMSTRHKDYLAGRGFDPDLLEAKYSLLGTGPTGHCPHRIVVPIFHRGRMVSWQARDVTGRAELRYVSASKANEEIPHKTILYNLDNCRGGSVLVVEGITDVWRLGDGACATFGTKFTQAQVVLLAGFRRVFLIYDGEAQAQTQARRLCRALGLVGVREVRNVILDGGDPGDLEQREAERLKFELLGEQNERL